jgi:hypothetical protein
METKGRSLETIEHDLEASRTSDLPEPKSEKNR